MDVEWKRSLDLHALPGGDPMKPGDMVQVLHPGFFAPTFGIIVEIQDGTGLCRVMLMGADNNKICRYSPLVLRKVSR